MKSTSAGNFLKIWLQVMAVCVLTVFVVGASDPGVRFSNLGHKMMCSCGCGQVLLECNHVGCPSSEGMRNELADAIAHGDADSVILNAFVAKYGPTILSAPTRGGFDNVAWIVPPVVFLLATIGAVLLIRRWRLRAVAVPAGTPIAETDEMRDRIRKDTEIF